MRSRNSPDMIVSNRTYFAFKRRKAAPPRAKLLIVHFVFRFSFSQEGIDPPAPPFRFKGPCAGDSAALWSIFRAGWNTLRLRQVRPQNDLEPRSDSIRSEKAQGETLSYKAALAESVVRAGLWKADRRLPCSARPDQLPLIPASAGNTARKTNGSAEGLSPSAKTKPSLERCLRTRRPAGPAPVRRWRFDTMRRVRSRVCRRSSPACAPRPAPR